MFALLQSNEKALSN